jgi:AraC-like DNA-binding protein
MAQLTRFSTRAFPPSRQFPVWRDCLRRFFGEVHATAKEAVGFDAWIESISEKEVVVTRMRAGPQYIEHTESAAAGEHRGFIHVVFPIAGSFHFEQTGHSAVLEPGDWGVYDLSRSFRSVTDHAVEMLVLAAPQAMILNRELDIDRIAARRFSSRSGGARIIKNYLASLLEEQGTLTPALRHDFATYALQLTRLTIMEITAGESCSKSPRVVGSRVKTYIASHARNAELSIDAVAAACGCSKRYIHKIFSSVGQTAGQYILQCRLNGSTRDLVNPEFAHLTITDIAVSWGFNSSSAFSRIFRKHFQASPRDYRAAALATDAAWLGPASDVEHEPRSLGPGATR